MIQPTRTGCPTLPVEIEHLGLRLLIFQLHFVAPNFDDLPLGRIGGVTGNHQQANQGSLLSTNFFDDLVELHVDNILELRLSLGDGSDAVVYRQTSIAIRRPARDNFLHLGIAVLGRKHCSNAHERELHGNLEVLEIRRAEILGVGIVGLRQRAEESLHDVALFHLADVAQNLIVPAGDRLRRRTQASAPRALP